MLLAALVLVAALAGLLALVGYLVLTPRAALRRAGVAAVWVALAPLPLLIPSTEPASGLTRFAAAVLVVLVAWKLYDLHVGYERHARPPLPTYLRFMLPGVGHLVFRNVGSEPGPGTAGNLRRLAGGAVELALGGAALAALFGPLDLGRTSFALEHAAKWLALYVALDGLIRLVIAAARLGDLDAVDIFKGDPILAPTPAVLWRRYNRIVGEWLREDVFLRRRLRRRPALATLAAFGASGLMHEYVFGIALLRVQGYQLAFFLLHGVAVVATARLKLRGWRAALGVALTLAFTLVTLVLFSASLDELLRPLVPFYAHGRPPLWAD